MENFYKLENTNEALGTDTALVERKIFLTLKKMLQKIFAEDEDDKLAVADVRFGILI